MIQINSTYNEDHIKERLQVFVERFYESMTTKLEGMTLKNITDKNPYLLRVKGFNTASDIVNSALNAYVSSAEETVFGNEVFEPLAKEVCNGNKALAEGVDVMIERDREIFAIAVKSGPRVFNADSKKRQIQNFEKAKKLAQQARKAYYPVIGYCYGRKDTEGHAYEMAGQTFWQAVSGDEKFYARILEWMEVPATVRDSYKGAFDRASNRLVREFASQYCDKTGEIMWEKLAAINSGKRR